MENNERNKVLINEKVLAKCLYPKKYLLDGLVSYNN